VTNIESSLFLRVEDFIYFASYRTHEEFNGGIHQAVVYPHSKLMIVDDRFTIIGNPLISSFLINFS